MRDAEIVRRNAFLKPAHRLELAMTTIALDRPNCRADSVSQAAVPDRPISEPAFAFVPAV